MSALAAALSGQGLSNVVTGSYIGDGTAGTRQLNFGRTPVVLFISGGALFIAISGVGLYFSNYSTASAWGVTFGDTYVILNTQYQLANSSGYTYNYIAIVI